MKLPLVAPKLSVKKLVEVLFVVEALVTTRLVAVAFVALKLVIVPEAEVRSSIVAVEMVVVAKVEVPLTVRVPCDVNDEVAVIDPPVIEEKIAVIPEIKLVKKLVEVAVSKNALRAKRLVAVALVVDEF